MSSSSDVGVAVTPTAGETTGRRDRWRRPTLSGLWAFSAVALPVIAALRATIVTNDLAYQIRAGDLMLRTHHLLRTDTFTFTALGRPWVDQQWGAQVVFALVYRAGGWAGLALLRAALVGATALFVLLACRAAGVGTRRAAWLALAGFAVWAGGAALRPQMFGMVLFSAIVWLAFERHRHPAWLWAVPVLTTLWENLHGSFFLSPLLLALMWWTDVRGRDPAARRTLLVAIASALATVLSPFGIGVWTYAFRISTDPVITRAITEWQPPTIRDSSGALFFASLAAVAVFLALRGAKTAWPTLALLGLFALIGLEAVRGIFWWAIVLPPVVAGLLPEASARKEGRSVMNAAIAAGLVVLAVASLPSWRAGSRASPSSSVVANAPVTLTDALRLVLRPGERFYNPVPWASWFELVLPGNPVFLDPRIEIFPRSVLDQHQDVSLGREGWQRVLDRWDIRVLVADRSEEDQLIPIIARDPGWRTVYSDAAGLILVRMGTP